MNYNKGIILIVTAGILLLSSCSKDEHTPSLPPAVAGYDTLYPLSYFPCWPGSWWLYVDSNGDSTITRSDTAWHLDSYVEGGAAYYSDTFYVPFYEGTPIWEYEAHTGPISNSGSYPLTRILSDSLPVGSSWLVHFWAGTGVSRRIIAIDTTLQWGTSVFYPTIGVEEYYSTGPQGEPTIAKRYYTAGIGLVREDLYNWVDTTVNTRWLNDFFINR
ncbi:MAG: hypothetical protein ACKO1U_06800 [Bacteroidota bacterium]